MNRLKSGKSSEKHPRVEEKLAEEMSEPLAVFLRAHAGQVRRGKQDTPFIRMKAWAVGEM